MRTSGTNLYEFEPFLLDAANRILLKDGVTVRLTPKAFETLLVLVQRRFQVVEKEQLLKEVWPDTFVEEGSLSRNIHELRKVLGDDSSGSRYIETIPKRGYRFIAPVTVIAGDESQLGFTGVESDATVIEKHTFARVISKEFEATDTPVDATPMSLAPAAAPHALPVLAEQVRRQTARAAVIAAGLLLASLIAVVFFYLVRPRVFLKRPEMFLASISRPKSTLIRLTNNNAMDGAPVWSPDGSKIAFWSNRDGKNEIYVMDADGTNVKRLTNNMSDDDSPKWSPDGRRILFGSERDGNREIYVMDADGSNQTRLTRNNASDHPSSWSPDGSQIAFASNRDNSYPNNLDIYVMNADGSNVRRIVNDPEYDARSLRQTILNQPGRPMGNELRLQARETETGKSIR